MFRRLLTLASAASVVAWAATVALWVTAQFTQWQHHRQTLTRPSPTEVSWAARVAGWDRDGVLVLSSENVYRFPTPTDADAFAAVVASLPPGRGGIGGHEGLRFRLGRGFAPERDSGRAMVRERSQWFGVAFWQLFLLFGVPSAVVLRRRWSADRERRRRSGAYRCAWCGYDLRATPGRCPECGTVPDAASRPV